MMTQLTEATESENYDIYHITHNLCHYLLAFALTESSNIRTYSNIRSFLLISSSTNTNICIAMVYIYMLAYIFTYHTTLYDMNYIKQINDGKSQGENYYSLLKGI